MFSVVALSCPVCAAPLQPDSSRCDYCRAVVVIKTDLPRIDPQLLNQGVVHEHIAQFRGRVRKDPHDEEAHYGLGVAYLNLGLLEESAAELAKAAAEMPEAPTIQHQLAVVYERLASSGRNETAARAAAKDRTERALLLRPTFADALLLKAKLVEQEGDRAGAVRVLRELVSLDPDLAQGSLKSFVAGHEAALLGTPRYSAKAARAERAATVQPKRDSLKRLAWAAAVVALLLIGAGVPWPGAALLPIAVVAYRGWRYPLETPKLRLEWEKGDAHRQQLVGSEPSPLPQLVEAAETIARAKARTDAATSPNGGSMGQPQAVWETCEILARDVAFKGRVFAVQVEGPKGTHLLSGYGEDRGVSDKRRWETHVRWLQQRLLAEGWEPYGMGRNWWNYKFRRLPRYPERDRRW